MDEDDNQELPFTHHELVAIINKLVFRNDHGEVEVRWREGFDLRRRIPELDKLVPQEYVEAEYVSDDAPWGVVDFPEPQGRA